MTVARQVIPGRTHFITRRCTQRQMLLRPDPEVERIYLYCLGEAVARFKTTLHAFIAMSNHQHIIVRDNLGNFPDFLAHLNKMIAKVMNARLGRWENFWATEQANAVYLVEPADRFDKLVYLLANPVTDDLVDRISDWPGANSLGLNLSGRSLTVKRPRDFFDPEGTMPSEVTVRVERLEGFEHLSESDWTAKLRQALDEEEERSRAKRHKSGRSVLGRKAVLLTRPTDRPQTIEPRRGLRPHIACLQRARRKLELAALAAFRIARSLALFRTLAGEENVIFPFGTYRIRGIFRTGYPPSVAVSSAL
jgi:REP element-mobilizing transposase RayT